MHPTSQTIANIIKGDQTYNLDILQQDLFPEQQEKLVSRKYVMERFGVCERTVHNWLDKFPDVSVKLGGNSSSNVRRIYIDRLERALIKK